MILSDIHQYRLPLFESRQSQEFISGPGLGKSSAIEAVVAQLSIDYNEPVGFLSRILSGCEAPDVKGFLMPLINKDTGEFSARFSRPAVFPDKNNLVVYENGEIVTDAQRLQEIGVPEVGLLFLDEFGQADTDVQKVAAELLLSQRINEYSLPTRWSVWAASNRVQDKSGVVQRLAFVDNRMASHIIDPSYESFERWCLIHGVHPLAITFAKRNPSVVFKDEVPKKGGKFCSPRALVMATALIERIRPTEMGSEKLPATGMALEWLIAWMGDGDAAIYAEHIALGSQLPSPQEVWEDPMGTPVPDRVDARFVMAANLSMSLVKARGVGGTSGPDNVGASLQYMSRFEEELQVVFVRGVVKKAPKVMQSPEFGEWASRNKKLILSAHAV